MCGIVGYMGPGNSVDIVLDGLKRLEYRGYDSAGICFKNIEGTLSMFKKMGKLENLKGFLNEQGDMNNAHICIGHTRWATHGEVSDLNAHPHLSDTMATDSKHSIAIVHNGIIENDMELKIELMNAGIKFHSQTDSEVFLGLLLDEFQKGHEIQKAITNAFQRVDGNSAFVIMVQGHDELFAIKKGAPLVCASNKLTEEVFVSSDPYALAGKANKIFFPEDNVLCCLHSARDFPVEFFELDGKKSFRVTNSEQGINIEVSEKGHHEHYMIKEIYEQPVLIKSLIEYYLEGEGRKSLLALSGLKPKRVHIIGCGTAWHAALAIKHFIEKFVKIPCHVDLASEFRYKNPLIFEDDIAVFISQSGETADTLAAQELCKKKKIKTISIVNVEGSTLYRNCDENLLINAGVEIGVASTKAFTLQVLTGRLMAAVLADTYKEERKLKLFGLLAERVDLLLANVVLIKKIAECIYNYKGFIFTGRGQDYPIALEGALKLKEIAYVHAEGYAAGELKHGPIALIDEQMVNIAIISNRLYSKTISNAQEVKARRGVMVIIGPEDDSKLEKMADYYIPMNYDGLEELTPLYINVVNQLLSYYMARFKGTDIDMPRNLAKSVTVE